ncbi:DUF5127 domain-containing protein [archaeon]|nr:MAG: DUF5127 domain-containing protein [archaeon]
MCSAPLHPALAALLALTPSSVHVLQVGDGWLVAAFAWNLGIITPTTPAQRFLVLSFDEIVVMSYYGLLMPPYWRRDLPVGDATVIPAAMLAGAFNSYATNMAMCTAFDAQNEQELTAAGNAYYSTITQLTYRQVLGATALAWHPTKVW